ncbi:MAG: L-histidine N(alpha)-methyltransferase [Actinomycetia bacterium]|nr:L-histidine N(alpha)-methyltransferase [Actinomycetes bacterium]
MTGDEARFTLTRIGHAADASQQMIADVCAGLTAEHKSLPSIYFYDDHGSALFEEITRLPEYYLARAEAQILEMYANDIIAAVHPDELVEIGAGYARKTQLLLAAIHEREAGNVYVAIDVSESALRHAGENLTEMYPWLEVRGYVGDFGSDLASVQREGRRLVAFLGSTIGNLPLDQRPSFFDSVASMLEGDDGFLLGIDLMKDESILIAAYSDSAGVSSAFNKNVLTVLNRELDGDFDLDAFDHVTQLNATTGCMEQSLRANRHVSARLETIDLKITMEAGESIHTEWSCKFTREQITEELANAGLSVTDWWSDAENRYALVLARRASFAPA